MKRKLTLVKDESDSMPWLVCEQDYIIALSRNSSFTRAWRSIARLITPTSKIESVKLEITYKEE